VLGQAQEGLIRARSELQRTGHLSLLDDHLDAVMRGLDTEGLPAEESELLLMLGFSHLAATIRNETDLLGSEWRNDVSRALPAAREYRHAPASGALDAAIQQVDDHRRQRREAAQRQRERQPADSAKGNDEEPRKTRKWWKGLGQVVEGASVATVNAGLAVGAFRVPVSPQTATYASVVSVGAGLGKIMSGVGDLWGE